MSEQNEYQIEREGNLEYVIVRCPNGHLSRGMKVSTKELRLGQICPNPKCNASWNPLIPEVMHLEAIP